MRRWICLFQIYWLLWAISCTNSSLDLEMQSAISRNKYSDDQLWIPVAYCSHILVARFKNLNQDSKIGLEVSRYIKGEDIGRELTSYVSPHDIKRITYNSDQIIGIVKYDNHNRIEFYVKYDEEEIEKYLSIISENETASKQYVKLNPDILIKVKSDLISASSSSSREGTILEKYNRKLECGPYLAHLLLDFIDVPSPRSHISIKGDFGFENVYHASPKMMIDVLSLILFSMHGVDMCGIGNGNVDYLSRRECARNWNIFYNRSQKIYDQRKCNPG